MAAADGQEAVGDAFKPHELRHQLQWKLRRQRLQALLQEGPSFKTSPSIGPAETAARYVPKVQDKTAYT